MKLYVDLDNLRLQTSATDRKQVSLIEAKRGDALPLEIRFIRNSVPVRLDATTTITFAIKQDGKYDADPLVLEASFAASAVGSPDSDPHYTATPSLNTTALNALYLINDDVADDPRSIDLMAELTWQATGDTGPTSIKTFTVRMANDVYRGDEGTPLSLDTPVEWIDDQNELRGISPIRSGATHLFPTSLTLSGEIIGDDTNPITLSPLAFDSLDSNGFPIYTATLADTGQIELTKGISDWELEYDGPSITGVLTYTFTSEKTDPNGLVLSASGRDDITITATDGKLPPKVGDRGLITGEGIYYVWDGNEWDEQITPFYDVIVVDGDSRSTGDSVGTWPTLLGSIAPFSGATITSVAVAGNETTDLVTDFTTNVTPLAPSATQNGLYMVYCGVNDIFQIGGVNVDNPRDIYDNLKTLWSDARDLGFKVVAFTLQHHSFAAAGITEPEQRQVQLNRLILSDPSKYDYLIPLHELIPDETVYGIAGVGENYIHNNVAGNQFIANNVARILGANDRTRNVPPLSLVDSASSEFRLKAFLGDQLNLFHRVNMSLSSDSTATGGTVSSNLGFKRLATTTSSGSLAAVQYSWPLQNSSNNIAWATSRYRGMLVDIDIVSLNSDQIVSIHAGCGSTTWDDSSIGFQIQKNGSNHEIRAQVIDGTPTTTTGSWVSMGASTNVKVIIYALDGNATLLWSNSNGATRHQVWQQISTTGSPVSNSAGTGLSRVVAMLEAGASAGGACTIDVREITLFESDTLPFSRLGY